MYLMYVDESGDVGLQGSPTRFFILSALVVHELRWGAVFDAIVEFRRSLRQRYGLKLREEIHAAHFLQSPGEVARIEKHRRLALLREVLDFEASLPDIDIINVVVDKQTKPATADIFEMAWETLLQRFHNTISSRNFRGPRNHDDKGIVIADNTDEKKLRGLLRRLRRYNPVPNNRVTVGLGYRQIRLTTIVEDAVHRDSADALFVQLADVNAYFLMQRQVPNKFIKKKGARHYFDKLEPVLCRHASTSDPQGVVRR